MSNSFYKGGLARVNKNGKAIAKEGSIVEVIQCHPKLKGYIRATIVIGEQADCDSHDYLLFLANELDPIGERNQ